MRTRTKKAPAVDAASLAAFKSALLRGTADDVSDVSCDLGDIPCGGSKDYLIKAASLPEAIPLPIRVALEDRTRAVYDIMNSVQAILGELGVAADSVYRKKKRQEEASRPRCDKCGQAIAKKR